MDKRTLKNKKIELIQELDSTKSELKDMLIKAKTFRQNIDIFTPEMFADENSGEKFDFRTKRKYNKFEIKESIKAVNDILSTEMNIHSRIESVIKTQYEMMQKELKLDDLESAAGQINSLEDIINLKRRMDADPELRKSFNTIQEKTKS
jgi:hypothetical protein